MAKPGIRKLRTPNFFPSMGNAAKIMGIPLADVKKAKRDGCKAFRGARVDRKMLLDWFKNKPAARPDLPIDVNWSEERVKFQAKRDALRLKKEEGQAIDFGEVRLCLGRGMASLFSTMERCFAVDLPPALKGLDEAAIQSRCSEMVETFKEAFKLELSKIINEDENQT